MAAEFCAVAGASERAATGPGIPAKEALHSCRKCTSADERQTSSCRCLKRGGVERDT